MLTLIYTLLLGLLSAYFIECAIYTFCPAPKPTWAPGRQMASDSPVDTLIEEEESERFRERSEAHSFKHYMLSLLGSMLEATIALQFHATLGVLADGILLGSVFTLGTGTVFGISGGGRLAKFAVATVSLVVALALGWVEFLPHHLQAAT